MKCESFCVDNTQGFSFILHAALVAIILANNLTPEDQQLLGDFFKLLGYNMTNIAKLAVKEECD